jgi:hypothetical protein
MMLFDPKVGLNIKGGKCGRKAGKGMGDNECYSETKKKWSWGLLPGVIPEKGHIAPEFKMANEITCNCVWDKLYPTFLLPALNGI